MSDQDPMPKEYRLTTAEIQYHLPGQPHLIQTFVWKEYDMAPRFPELHRFLKVWSNTLDGAVHSVRVTHLDRMRPDSHRHGPNRATLH